jgi:hypothetical protein
MTGVGVWVAAGSGTNEFWGASLLATVSQSFRMRLSRGPLKQEERKVLILKNPRDGIGRIKQTGL